MTLENKKTIYHYRAQGFGYRRIAKLINLPVSTVKSFLYRHPVANFATVNLDTSESKVSNNNTGLPAKASSSKKYTTCIRSMDKELFNRVVMYQVTMALLRCFVANELITPEEYNELEKCFKTKYNLEKSVIYV